jgi:PP-loop superfamily ATP-utilizing enzyme
MKTLYLDLCAGISGDMFLGLLVDLGVDPRTLGTGIGRLGVDGWQLSADETRKGAIGGTRVAVQTSETDVERHLDERRPGRQAAVERLVKFPLQEAGLAKSDVRALAQELGLPVWNRPPSPCLITRVPYGTPVDAALLGRIEKAEEELRAMGFAVVRVRHHGPVARVELPADELGALLGRREEIVRLLRGLGWTWAALDLSGYEWGSMDRGIPKE